MRIEKDKDSLVVPVSKNVETKRKGKHKKRKRELKNETNDFITPP